MPCLRALKIRFYAYNPVAGGLLTNRYSTPSKVPVSGRFGTSSKKGQMYRDRYWTAAHFEALSIIRHACDECHISVQTAAHRWLAHHSKLRWGQNDAVIVGCSSIAMLRENVRDLREGGPLPVLVLVAMEEAWQRCKDICPIYYRAYSTLSHAKVN